MYPHLTKYDMWRHQERKITWRYMTLLFDQTLRILVLSFTTETNLFLLTNGKLDFYKKFKGLKHLNSLKNWQKIRIWSWLWNYFHKMINAFVATYLQNLILSTSSLSKILGHVLENTSFSTTRSSASSLTTTEAVLLIFLRRASSFRKHR